MGNRSAKNFAIRGYVLDKERLKNGTFLNEEYFDHLLEEIREIRASERKFYQKITDIYKQRLTKFIKSTKPPAKRMNKATRYSKLK